MHDRLRRGTAAGPLPRPSLVTSSRSIRRSRSASPSAALSVAPPSAWTNSVPGQRAGIRSTAVSRSTSSVPARITSICRSCSPSMWVLGGGDDEAGATAEQLTRRVDGATPGHDADPLAGLLRGAVALAAHRAGADDDHLGDRARAAAARRCRCRSDSPAETPSTTVDPSIEVTMHKPTQGRLGCRPSGAEYASAMVIGPSAAGRTRRSGTCIAADGATSAYIGP